MSVCVSVCGGQRNIKKLFFSKLLFSRFFDMGITNLSDTRSGTMSDGVVWPVSTSEVKETSKPSFAWKSVFRGFRTQGRRTCVCVGLRPLPGGLSDPPSLPGSKEHRKLFLSENSFPAVFRHEKHGYECELVSALFQGGRVTPVHFRGQKNTDTYFC